MIEPMVKYSIVLYHNDLVEFLQNLQSVGMLDVSIRQSTEDISKSESDYALLKKVESSLTEIHRIKLLSKLKFEDKVLEEDTSEHLIADRAICIIDNFQESLEEFAQFQHTKANLLKEESENDVWGEFSLERLKSLEATAGVEFVFATAEKKYLSGDNLQLYNVEIINIKGSIAFFVFVKKQQDDKLDFPFNIVDRPKTDKTHLELAIQKNTDAISKVESKIYELCEEEILLKAYKNILLNRVSFSSVLSSVESVAEDKIKIVEGFVPKKDKEAFETFILAEDVVFEEKEFANLKDEEVDQAPVLLKNNWFSRLFEPITNIFSLPTYRELDLTPMFAPFFMMFFGFCFGDAGYGLLLVVAALVLRFKLKKEHKPMADLVFFFGLATIVFGSLSGSFFGIPLFEVEALKKFKNIFLDMDQLMTLSLVLGAIQILFGMLIKILNISRQQGFKYALSTLGWLVFIVVAIASFGLPQLGIVVSGIILYSLYTLMGLSLLLILFYNTPGKNIFINFGSALWDTYNMVTGLIGDLLSYIRLFALGLTGGILGNVFNTLAVEMSGDIPVLSTIFAFLILILGHGLNFALCILGSVVHPLRLTFVEFYKNAGFQGGGKLYSPFRIEK